MNVKPRLLVTSLPKSGTHLLGEFLRVITKQEAVHWVHYIRENGKYAVSLNRSGFGGNRDEWINFSPRYPYAYYTAQDFDNPLLFLNIIRNGEYALSHLVRSHVPVDLDNSFMYLVTVRNIESIVASAFNAEAKIAREQPYKRDSVYASLDLANPKEADITNFVNIYFDGLVPHALDLLYWRFSTRSVFLSFEDLTLRGKRFEKFMQFMAAKLGFELNPTAFNDPMDRSPTKITNSDKILTSDDVLSILGKNPLLAQINENFQEALKERSVYL